MARSFARIPLFALVSHVLLAPAAYAQTIDAALAAAKAWMSVGDFPAAVPPLRRCLAINAREPTCLLLLANVLELRLSRHAEALPIARAAVDALPDDFPAEPRGMAQALYGMALAGVDDWEEALPFITKAQQLLDKAHSYQVLLDIVQVAAAEAQRTHAGLLRDALALAAKAAEALKTGPPPPPLRLDSGSADFTARSAYYRSTTFRIKEVLQDNAQDTLVRLECDALDRVTTTQKGAAFALYRGQNDRPSEAIADAEVIEGGVDALVRLRRRLVDGKAYPIRSEDLVTLPSAYRWDAPPSVLVSLARLLIALAETNAVDAPLLLDPAVVRTTGPLEPTQVVLVRLARRVRDVATALRSASQLPEAFVQPLSQGPHVGLTVIDLMERATAADLLPFLYFVETYPGKYSGLTWAIADVYGNWLLAGSPPGAAGSATSPAAPTPR